MASVVSPSALSARALAVLLVAVAVVEALVALDAETISSTWWTSVGLGVALLALSPVRRWPAYVVALVAVVVGVRLAVGDPLDASLADACSHALEAVVGALVLTRALRRPARLVTQADLSGLVTASLVVGVLALGEPVVRGGALPTADLLFVTVASHAVSTMLLCSVVLLSSRTRLPSAAVPELVVQLLALSAVTAVVFAPDQQFPLAFGPLPLLVWAALRFDSGIVVAQLTGFAVAVTTTTGRGHGPFASSGLDANDTGTVVLTYLLTSTLISLPLALTVRHRLRLMARVSADEHLFRRSFTESPLGMMMLREEAGDLVIDELNTAVCTILDARHDDIVGRRLGDVLDTYDPTDHGLTALLRGTRDAWHGHAVALGRPGSRLEVAVVSLDWRDGARIYSAQMLDVTQEHDAHRRLVAAHRLNDATLDTTACIILVTDATGTVVRVNAATRDITGYGDHELLGHRLWNTPLSALSRAETEAMFVWPNRSGYPMVTERLGRTAEGDPLRIVWNNNVVRDELGLPSYAVLTGIDVTAERSSTGLMSHLLSASIATALIGVDGKGRITLFNAGASHMLGWPAAEIVGMPFIDLFDQGQVHARTGSVGSHDAFLSLVGMIGDRDESPARDWTWRTRNGHELIVSMTLSVTEDLGEDRVGFLCVGRDVTEQREGQETLVAALEKERTAVERLSALDHAKDEFVSTVSHELRTPVTSIIGYTEMLRDGSIVEASPEQLPMLETIARNGQRLVAICNDLLLLSGFDADMTMGVRTRVDLRESVRSAAETLSVVPDEHGVTLLLEPGTSPLVVTGDSGQLDRLVANLLGNAVKFTPAGGRVTASLGHDGERALLTVADTGIGIPAEDLDTVFQRFYRSQEAQLRAIPGTGLGLSIVAAIVKSHEGEIAVESEVGVGTTFRVSIPLTEPLPAESPSAGSSVPVRPNA